MTPTYRSLWLMLLALPLGCPKKSDKVIAGDVDLCAGISGQPEPDTGFDWDIDGEVIGDVAGDALDTGEPCQNAQRVLQIAASDGKTYDLGYGLYDADDAPIAVSLGLNTGDQVQMELLATIGYFYTGYGLVLRHDDALVAAISDNKEPPSNEVTVAEGHQIAAEDNTCGTRRGWEMVFRADDTLTLTPVDSDVLTVSGTPMTAWAMAGWDWSAGAGEQCTDLLDFWEWAVILQGE